MFFYSVLHIIVTNSKNFIYKRTVEPLNFHFKRIQSEIFNLFWSFFYRIQNRKIRIFENCFSRFSRKCMISPKIAPYISASSLRKASGIISFLVTIWVYPEGALRWSLNRRHFSNKYGAYTNVVQTPPDSIPIFTLFLYLCSNASKSYW